jgi:hypothetical protein
LPELTNIRRVFVDNSTSPVTFWAGDNHGAEILRVEPLDWFCCGRKIAHLLCAARMMPKAACDGASRCDTFACDALRQL